jgi:hypothetical protein
LISISAAVIAGATLGFVGWSRSRQLAEEHATGAQRALDEMGRHYANIATCSEALETTANPVDKARYESMIKSSNRILAKLAVVADRRERLARSYGYKASLKRPEPFSKP